MVAEFLNECLQLPKISLDGVLFRFRMGNKELRRVNQIAVVSLAEEALVRLWTEFLRAETTPVS